MPQTVDVEVRTNAVEEAKLSEVHNEGTWKEVQSTAVGEAITQPRLVTPWSNWSRRDKLELSLSFLGTPRETPGSPKFPTSSILLSISSLQPSTRNSPVKCSEESQSVKRLGHSCRSSHNPHGTKSQNWPKKGPLRVGAKKEVPFSESVAEEGVLPKGGLSGISKRSG